MELPDRMKKLLILVACFALSAQSYAAFALAQTVKTNATGAAGSTRAVTTSAIGTGNLLVVVGCWNGSGTSSTPTATGLTFTQVGTDATDGGTNKTAMWYAKNTTSGATTVTFNISASASFLDAYVLEFTGADTVAPLRTSQIGTGSSATASTAALTVTVGDLIVGGAIAPSVTATNMGVLDSNADGNGLGHTLSAASTSITPTFTTGSGTWVMKAAAFIPSGAAATKTCTLALMGAGPC
jgi:hypothetical protein